MKKVLMILVCLCILAVPVLAVEPSDFEYQTKFGTSIINWNRYYYALAQEKIANSGVALDADNYVSGFDNSFTFDNATFEADYAAALEAIQVAESEVVDNGATEVTVSSQPTNDTAFSDKYPLGSYIDEMGRVYSPTGELLSSRTEAPSYLDTIVPILDEVLDASDESVVGDETIEPHIYSVVDLRSNAAVPLSGVSGSQYGATDGSDDQSSVSSLKGLISSIFGEYTPVMTTAVVTETVENETTTTLIDTVAGGAAGVDYAWLAGVFLFGILLFCLMKLLGGILK